MSVSHEELQKLKSEGDINLSPIRQEWADGHINESTREILEEDEQYFLHQSLSTPCLNALQGCEGSYLIDVEGRKILDFHGNSVHQVGFSHPKIISAIKNQLDELSFCTRRYTNQKAIDLAKKLTSLSPGNLNRVLFTPGGTSAIGMALKLARIATGKFKTISMWDSFHGASLDAISLGGEAVFRKGIGPLLPGTEHVPPPDTQNCPFGCGETCNLKCAEYIDYVLEKEGDVAAVVAETVRCTPFIPPNDYWKIVREACDRHGALLILDEIPVGLGRTGKMFAVEHYGIVPDMLVLGKGMGGAVFPFAALLAKEELNVYAHGALGHYTHEKSPVGCAAALATIDVIEEENLLANSTEMGEYAKSRILKMQEKFPIIADVRGTGLLMGIELIKNKEPKEKALDEAEQMMYRCLEKGLSFKLTMGNILTLTPPLTISREEMDMALTILEECFEAISS